MRPLGSTRYTLQLSSRFSTPEPAGLPDLRVQPSLLVARTARRIGHPFVDLPAVRRIGKPVAAVRMTRDVVRRIQPLALERIGDHRDRSVVLVAHHAAAGMLARELASLMIERVAVAVARRLAEHGDAPVILDPSHLPVVRDVAPDQILPLAVPRRSFAPHAAGPQPLNRRVADAQRVERRIERDDVGIGIGDRLRKIARRIRDDARRIGFLCLSVRSARRQVWDVNAATPAALPILVKSFTTRKHPSTPFSSLYLCLYRQDVFQAFEEHVDDARIEVLALAVAE